MRNWFSGLLLISAAGSAAEPGPDGLCYRLGHLEREVTISRSARSTSVKVMWLPGRSGVCEAHRRDPGARELCRWLTKRMSWELPNALPGEMLACYGIGGDPFARGTLVDQTFAGRTKARNRVEIATDRGGTKDSFPSVRLTIRKGAR
jgi:hypothetical protein